MKFHRLSLCAVAATLTLILSNTTAQAAYVAASWTDTVHLLDDNLTSTGSFSTGADSPNGIATDGVTIYTGRSTSQEVVAYDINGDELFRWSATLVGLQGMDLVDGELAVARGNNIEFFEPETGAFIRSIPSAGISVEGIGYDDQILWQIADSTIIGIDPADGTVLANIPNAASGCAHGGTGITSSASGELTLGCTNGNWFIVSSEDGSVLSSGNNGLDMYGLNAPFSCGDGVVEGSEQCDDSNRDDGDGCNSVCSFEYCGNGYVDSANGEICDDGNNLSGDGCSGDCGSSESCGNGYVDVATGEQCDDGNNTDGDGCQGNCALPSCGDGVLDAGETCDDGNQVSGDGCNATCSSAEVCGNSVMDTATDEQCDDGNTSAGDGCDASCSLEVCGNGNLDDGETCDDGNQVSGDGCSSDCQSDETCGNGSLDDAVGEACDDGNNTDGDGCQGNCALPSCGDGALDAGETCDDGNNVSGDGCNATCTSNESCGNEVVDKGAGEFCDEGADNGAGECEADCQPKTGGGGCGAAPQSGGAGAALAGLMLLGLGLMWRRRRRLCAHS